MDLEDFFEFADIVQENDENVQMRIPKRYIRDADDPFEYYEEIEFKRRYRFSKETVREVILPLINNEIAYNNRGLPIPPVQQLFIALRFYATGDFQIVDGDLRSVSQPTVSRTVKKVSEALASHLRTFVKFSDDLHLQQLNMQKFFELGHFPGVSACVDGTHIPIKNPGDDRGEVFRNRKGIFSLNVQVACGPTMEILDIIVRFPGSMHDNVIFERSSLRLKYENNEIPGKILGDNGYACRRYLLTPVLNPVRREEHNYNLAHKRTRNIVERTFGIWKQRFPCLKRKLNTKLETSVAVICAVAVLHNIARSGQDDVDGNFVGDNEVGYVGHIIDNPNADALHYRRAFILAHFGN